MQQALRKCLIGTLALLLLVQSGLAQSTTESEAAVVISFGEDRVIVRRVAFSGESITGLELFQRSGLDLATNQGMICRIAGVGCPAENCWCQCDLAKPPCVYWRYFHLQEGQWRYSGLGAGQYLVKPGGVDGWAWGDNSARLPAVEPGALFDPQRLGPGLPQVRLDQGNLDVEVDFQGDANHNAAVSAQFRRLGDGWSAEIPLERDEGRYRGRLAVALWPGRYEVRLTYRDADGVNGSSSWLVSLSTPGATELYVPLVLTSSP